MAMTNNKQTSIDWFFDQLVLNRIIIINVTSYGDKVKYKHEILLDQAREMYDDEIEAAIIKQCAEESTSAAHHKEVHRQQIIEAYIAAKMERNLVKKHFAYFLKLERVTQKAQEYYNETYGGGEADEQAKEMYQEEIEEKLNVAYGNGYEQGEMDFYKKMQGKGDQYADGYSEGYKRALELVEWKIKTIK